MTMDLPDHVHRDFSRALDRVADALADMGAGSPGRYAACWARSDDATLFGAWGPIEKGHGPVTQTFEWVGSRFSGGQLIPEYQVVDVVTSPTPSGSYAAPCASTGVSLAR